MHRLLVSKETLRSSTAMLPPAASHHLKVLRPKQGEQIELFDGYGSTRVYTYSEKGLSATGEIVTMPSPSTRLTLFACVTKGSRWDWTIEKAVELGVGRIVPVLSERCIVRLAAAERLSKAERWRRIAEDAARQSDAVWLPEVLPAVDFGEALELAKTCRCTFAGALVVPPPPSLLTAVEAVDGEGEWGLFVGPEGDFTPDELESLLKVAVPVSFGPTILRAETAAIFGLSVLAAAVHRQQAIFKKGKQS